MKNIQSPHFSYSSYQPNEPGFIESDESGDTGNHNGGYRFISKDKAFNFESKSSSRVTEEDPEDTKTARAISKANYGDIL